MKLLLALLCAASMCVVAGYVSNSDELWELESYSSEPSQGVRNLTDTELRDNTFGLIIDGGSGGSRMHIYMWQPRLFDHAPVPYTVPVTKVAWKFGVSPGVEHIAPNDMATYLTPLLEFAERLLLPNKAQWHTYPIFLKATGGLRERREGQREEILGAVRTYLNTTGFWFMHDFARVISGEEEGTYGWLSINWLSESLGLASQTLCKSGVAGGCTGQADPHYTLGALDLGGSSTQITFFPPTQDILANMFRLQIGERSHWNLYTHSFLHFGALSAFVRITDLLCQPSIVGDWAVPDAAKPADCCEYPAFYNPCFPKGQVVDMEVDVLAGVAASNAMPTGAKRPVTYVGTGEYHKCVQVTQDFLMQKDQNSWCEYAHGGQCSFAGVYQPPLAGSFHAFGQYTHAVEMLGFKTPWKVRP